MSEKIQYSNNEPIISNRNNYANRRNDPRKPPAKLEPLNKPTTNKRNRKGTALSTESSGSDSKKILRWHLWYLINSFLMNRLYVLSINYF